jgi:Fe-S cluster assembly protein SufD
MSIQVSPVNISSSDTGSSDTGLSAAAQKRSTYLAHLLNLAKQPAIGFPELQALRDRASVRVQEQAFPTTRDEEWRFTDLSPLLDVTLERVAAQVAVEASELETFALPEAANSRLVFVNGVFAPALSATTNLPQGLIVGNLAQVWSQFPQLSSYLGQQSGSEELFTALNTTGLTDAAVVVVPKNLEVDTPIHVLLLSTATKAPCFIQPRCLVVAEANSAVTVIEEHRAIGSGTYFTNTVAELWLAENAQVNHIRIQQDAQAAFHIGKTAVSQARDSRYTCHAISLGAKLSRHNLEIYQTGEQTHTVLNGLTMIRGEQLADTHSSIALSKPYGTSRQLQKCIVDDRAHVVFNGKVSVPQAAQQTDAGQLNRNLLLSSKARVDTKPQLEIVADNVKCTHGATVGQLDADEIFYLQSRGIDADSARSLLIYAFALDIINQIPIASLRQTLSQQVASQQVVS